MSFWPAAWNSKDSLYCLLPVNWSRPLKWCAVRYQRLASTNRLGATWSPDFGVPTVPLEMQADWIVYGPNPFICGPFSLRRAQPVVGSPDRGPPELYPLKPMLDERPDCSSSHLGLPKVPSRRSVGQLGATTSGFSSCSGAAPSGRVTRSSLRGIMGPPRSRAPTKQSFKTKRRVSGSSRRKSATQGLLLSSVGTLLAVPLASVEKELISNNSLRKIVLKPHECDMSCIADFPYKTGDRKSKQMIIFRMLGY